MYFSIKKLWFEQFLRQKLNNFFRKKNNWNFVHIPHTLPALELDLRILQLGGGVAGWRPPQAGNVFNKKQNKMSDK